MVDVDARRLTRLPDFVQRIPTVERSSGVTMDSNQKLDPVDPVAWEQRFQVRKSDLDMVGHVNNVRYIQWVTDTVSDHHGAERLQSLELLFRREARFGETVVCRTGSVSETQLAHRLTAEDDDRELVQARTDWALD